MSTPIDLYLGEFTVSPIPLELAFNYCSHACHFCFANLNRPDRTADMEGLARQLTGVHQAKNLPGLLMQTGYPVLVSNKVDPFAHSNYRQAVPTFEMMTQLGIPYAIQTRGGRGIDDVLSFAPPLCWYVSIAQLDDSIRARIEPGAPPIEERIELIQKLCERGHRVVVGINPVVPEWLPEPEPLVERCVKAGAEGIWVEPLHLSYRQRDRMTERGKQAVTLKVIENAMKRHPTPESVALYERTRQAALSAGVEVYSVGQAIHSRFWLPYQELYPTFPVMQDFVNLCHEELEDGALIGFETFADFFCDGLPEGVYPISRYISAKARLVLRENKVPSSMTYREVLAMIWSEPEIGSCPARIGCFSYAATKRGNDWIQYVDDNQLPIMVFTKKPAGFSEYFVDVDRVEAA